MLDVKTLKNLTRPLPDSYGPAIMPDPWDWYVQEWDDDWEDKKYDYLRERQQP